MTWTLKQLGSKRMTTVSEQIALLKGAVPKGTAPTSDFDLTPGVKLPENRVLRPAAVLAAFQVYPDGLRLLLTKRSSKLKHHPGQIAFPGGKVDEGDSSIEAAALREAKEEINLPAANVELLGRLPVHETVTSFEVTPVVALIHDRFDEKPEPGEVEEVFRVPFTHVMNQASYSVQSRRWLGQKRSFYTAPYGPYYIWGATARILRGLAGRVPE